MYIWRAKSIPTPDTVWVWYFSEVYDLEVMATEFYDWKWFGLLLLDVQHGEHALAWQGVMGLLGTADLETWSDKFRFAMALSQKQANQCNALCMLPCREGGWTEHFFHDSHLLQDCPYWQGIRKDKGSKDCFACSSPMNFMIKLQSAPLQILERGAYTAAVKSAGDRREQWRGKVVCYTTPSC